MTARAGQRVASYLMDLGLVAVAGLAVWWFTSSWPLVALSALELGVLLSLLRAHTGRTPGGWATGTIATATEPDAQGWSTAPGLRRQAIASGLFGLAHCGVLVPLIGRAMSRSGQDWSERIAGIRVLDLRAVTAQQADPSARMELDAYGRATQATPTWQGPTRQDSFRQDSHRQASPLWLVLDSGQREQLVADAVVGRAPSPAPGGWEQVVVVEDSTRSLSRNHLRIGVDADGIWVEDTFSANGTAISSPTSTEVVELIRGQRTHIAAGTVLRIGERSLMITDELPDDSTRRRP